MIKTFITVGFTLVLPCLASAVTMEMVTVGDPGNAPDPLNTNSVPSIGSVSYTYQIGKYEVRNSEYVEFLNSVAATDTYGLYNPSMSSDARGGINRTGISGSYAYSLKNGYTNMPVVFVSFYDAIRFVNWMENGQHTGVQGAGTTETGSYAISGGTSVGERETGATWVLPTENEWYKAAYYQPASAGGPSDNYWLYPMQTDSIPYSDQPPGTGSPSPSRAANFYRDDGPANGYNDGYATTGDPGFNSGANYLTDAGAYTFADSYYGTLDQGGNVEEWNEAIVPESARQLRGGGWAFDEASLRSVNRDASWPLSEESYFGFRVAMIPEPGAFAALGLAGLAVCIWRRRRR